MGARVDFIAASADTAARGARRRRRAPPRFRLPVGGGARDRWRDRRVADSRTAGWSRAACEAGPVSAGYREIRRGLTGGELVLTGGVDPAGAGDARGRSRANVVVSRLTHRTSTGERPMALVEIRDVYKTFTRGAERIDVFTGLTLDVEQGSFTALMGPSGSGKSTLLNLIAGPRQAHQRHRAGRRRRGERDDARATRRLARASTSGSCSRASTCCRCSRRTRTWSCRCC